jgi:predicted DNA-binding protein (MmcQ/YjbR family)
MRIDVDWLRSFCLALPGATEHVIWEGDLTFKVADKMFAHTVLEPTSVWLSFKSSPERFAELTERSGIIPAPYLARAQWVALETRDALTPEELEQLLREAYDLVVARLPRKTREKLATSPAKHRAKKKPAAASKKSAPRHEHTSKPRASKQ